ncbi:McrB family protein [Prevotella bivia]|uniref:McrB family protein n=1 Tax=Prevotella bivia TaxID=28125 RepID=UPI00254F4B4D|nr:hypothetical protein [Prevotella bivia]WIL17392.1 hypothetical protein QP022_03715 [Prevotella bivia]
MSYLSKETILKAYEYLSHLSKDPTLQGATQKVSAIRYFMALDSFYLQFHKDCNTRDKNDKKEYADHVGFVCDVCQNLYTTNFYYPLKEHNKDFGVGSNFYSAGQVNYSIVNPEEMFAYPKRGGTPLFHIKNGVLIHDEDLYSNFDSYIGNMSCRVAFVLWLLRKTPIDDNNNIFDGIRKSIRGVYSKSLVDILISNEDSFKAELGNYELSLNDKFYLIREEDINSLFNVKNKNHRPIVSYNMSNQNNKEINYLTALRTKPFMLLAGISGTGKSRIVRKLAQATVTEELQRANGYTGDDFANDRWTLHSPANFELIQVKPNWHNSMDVIGYLSNIPSPHYVFTPFIEFIVKAWQHPEVPFFLCLDEMNLAPVEEYFAEFLSAIESRSFEGEEYLTDPIIKPFNSFGEEVAKMMVNTLFPNFMAADKNSSLGKVVDHLETKGLTLPKNLIVIGTVNMDETTFSFSRKVLDRAMSVEMNEVNYDSFLTDTTDDDLKAIVKALEENDDAYLNTLLVDRHIEAREIIDDLGDDARFAIDYLKRINALLEGTPFKLGYRAANEALIYLQASYEFGQTNRIAALDNFTLMKILSRIEGDETKLKITDSEADKERIAKAEVNVDEAKQYGEMNILTALRYIITNQLGEQDKLHSVKKIDSMLSQLKRDHFVSFWN